MLVGCFSGKDALGLPCERDEDCGDGQRCEAGFCGGPPVTSTSSGSGTESTGDESSSTGVPASCGNGMVEAGENEIAPGVFETCDRGPDGADDCDPDCTAVECGDGVTNAFAGEKCDEGDDADDLDACTPQCFATLFADDLSRDPDATGNWTTDKPEITNTCDSNPDPFTLTTSGWVWSPGSFASGPEPTMQAGAARLISREVAIPADLPAGARVELRFSHEHAFGTCGGVTRADGGVVQIEVDGSATTLVPEGGYPDDLADQGGCLGIDRATNPLVPLDGCTPMTTPAFVGATAGRDSVRADIDAWRGQTVRAIFHMGFDCAAACGDPYEGWTIEDVVVAPYCAPTPGCPDGWASCCGAA
jgi:hypothetical protein